jgi:hypothetical protein
LQAKRNNEEDGLVLSVLNIAVSGNGLYRLAHLVHDADNVDLEGACDSADGGIVLADVLEH